MSLILYSFGNDVKTEACENILQEWHVVYQKVILEKTSETYCDLQEKYEGFSLPCLFINEIYYFGFAIENMDQLFQQIGLNKNSPQPYIFSEERRHQRLARENTQRFF